MTRSAPSLRGCGSPPSRGPTRPGGARSPGWSGDVRRVLEAHNAALCWADRKGAITPLWRTADWGYLRFHEGKRHPWPFYTERELAAWATRLEDVFPDDADDVFVYFNNDPGCAAIDNAITFAEQARRR